MARLALTALLFTIGAATAAALMTWRSSAESPTVHEAILVPPRTAADPPPIPSPPSTPAHADTLPPLTFDVETIRGSGERAERTTQTIARSADRVRVLLHGGHQEWLFVRNGIYRDRTSGYLADHKTRQIRFYDESPLRSVMGIRGWLDILAVRFDRATLPALRDSGERRHAYGTTFVRYVGAAGQDGVVDVWWSESLLLPMSWTVRDAGIESTSLLQRLAMGADVALLADPRVRFSTYKEVDAADVERH